MFHNVDFLYGDNLEMDPVLYKHSAVMELKVVETCIVPTLTTLQSSC